MPWSFGKKGGVLGFVVEYFAELRETYSCKMEKHSINRNSVSAENRVFAGDWAAGEFCAIFSVLNFCLGSGRKRLCVEVDTSLAHRPKRPRKSVTFWKRHPHRRIETSARGRVKHRHE